jgi:hypothetical protein
MVSRYIGITDYDWFHFLWGSAEPRGEFLAAGHYATSGITFPSRSLVADTGLRCPFTLLPQLGDVDLLTLYEDNIR